MPLDESVLGTCPNCGTAIPERRILIEYETPDGTDVYTDCPGCRDVVTPE